MFSFASETFTFTADGSCGRYAVTWYGLPAATRPVVQPVRSKREPPAPSKMNRETYRIRAYWKSLTALCQPSAIRALKTITMATGVGRAPTSILGSVLIWLWMSYFSVPRLRGDSSGSEGAQCGVILIKGASRHGDTLI